MDQSKINVRYAKAFFGLAKDKGLTVELRKDAALITAICETSGDFRVLIESPVVKTSQKTEVFKHIFSGHIHELSLNFLILIANHKRESYIPGIFRNLEDLYRSEEGIKSAVLTSAQPVSESLITEIRKTLETQYNAKVQLTQKVNSNLIGGFVLRVDDKQYDASLSTQLKKIREQLLHTELK
jgi:F-type H+-transporting ATPase subunit delta